jgi:hypothetical protein
MSFSGRTYSLRPPDPSGLTDTIHDLILDTVGAALVSIGGWRFLAQTRESRLYDWAKNLIQRRS